MNNATAVFDPDAAADLRNIVQTMVVYHNVLGALENTCGSRAGARAWLWQGVDEARGTLCGRARLHRCILDTFSFQARPFL